MLDNLYNIVKGLPVILDGKQVRFDKYINNVDENSREHIKIKILLDSGKNNHRYKGVELKEFFQLRDYLLKEILYKELDEEHEVYRTTLLKFLMNEKSNTMLKYATYEDINFSYLLRLVSGEFDDKFRMSRKQMGFAPEMILVRGRNCVKSLSQEDLSTTNILNSEALIKYDIYPIICYRSCYFDIYLNKSMRYFITVNGKKINCYVNDLKNDLDELHKLATSKQVKDINIKIKQCIERRNKEYVHSNK